ncbi:MAG: enoyl-CoA hydratase/isomerase family protein [Solirubrobacteraceae bacterium]
MRQQPGRRLTMIGGGDVPTDGHRSASAKTDGRSVFQLEQIAYVEDGPIARITLNRPEARNALSMQLSEELIAAIEHVRWSDSVKVVVLSGAAETFCAGDDVSEMPRWGNARQVMRRVRMYQQMANGFEELDKVTVAAVDGYAIGGGVELTLACDFVIAAERARWGMPEIDLGVTPAFGGTNRISRLIGRRMTMEVNMLGALYPARRAVELGLWNRAVPHAELDAEVDRLLEVVISKDQQAIRQLKLIVNKGMEADLYTAQGLEALSNGLSAAVSGAWRIDDADQGGGVLGFKHKRELWKQRRELARDFWVDR